MLKERNKEQRRRSDRTERREQSSCTNKLQCSFCSGEHFMKDSEDFKTRNGKPKKKLENQVDDQAGIRGRKTSH